MDAARRGAMADTLMDTTADTLADADQEALFPLSGPE